MRRLGILLVVAAVLAPITALSPLPAGAAGLLSCNAAANTTVVLDETTGLHVWTIVGKGTCTGNKSTYFMDLSASGTSDGLGVCTQSDVGNLDLDTVLTLVSTATGQSQTMALNLGAASSTYPVTTPFAVTRAGAPVGGGTLFTHIFLACPPLGTPSTTMYFEIIR